MEQTMYNMLLRLPLFQGMSRGDLFEVLEKTTFHFRRVEDGKVLFHQGERCDELAFLMDGTLEVETRAQHGSFSFTEELRPYTAIEVQSLLGKSPHYKSTYTARGGVSLFSIGKRQIYTLIDTYEIFRINLLNTLCSRVENLYERLWLIAPYGIEGRLVLFIRNLCTAPQGPKKLRVKMEDLAGLLDETRLNVSRVLNRWHEEGLIEMRRKEFVIHDMAALLHKIAPQP